MQFSHHSSRPAGLGLSVGQCGQLVLLRQFGLFPAEGADLGAETTSGSVVVSDGDGAVGQRARDGEDDAEEEEEDELHVLYQNKAFVICQTCRVC